MAKNNNLTDFLTSLANKLRSKLGTNIPINPQDFESRIDDVYTAGYNAAPVGVDTSDATANEADILSGATAYVNGQKITGIFEPLDTSDATANEADILSGATAYVNGVKLTGSHVCDMISGSINVSIDKFNNDGMKPGETLNLSENKILVCYGIHPGTGVKVINVVATTPGVYKPLLSSYGGAGLINWTGTESGLWNFECYIDIISYVVIGLSN